MLTAQDMSYDEARNLHSKWQKHQAFMAELASNKDWLDKIDKVLQPQGDLHIGLASGWKCLLTTILCITFHSHFTLASSLCYQRMQDL